ncbi:MAG: M48 family metallopeptidase [Dehalococcoidia bacterium]|nr:M48 family metallopeptidase [Dehalococcoidia bacterium]
MANSKTIDIDGVGPVLFEHSKRAKKLNISVKPFKGVRVAVPDRLSFKKAEDFVYTKTDWINKHLDKMRQYEKRRRIASASSYIDRAEAKRILTEKLNYLAEKHGYSYNRIFIRNQKTRWGSCSHKNNINLNMKLINVSNELMEYVILHELVHTRIKNHSKDFWTELDTLVGNGKRQSARLKKYGFELLL